MPNPITQRSSAGSVKAREDTNAVKRVIAPIFSDCLATLYKNGDDTASVPGKGTHLKDLRLGRTTRPEYGSFRASGP
jgi:hypothetical protein